MLFGSERKRIFEGIKETALGLRALYDAKRQVEQGYGPRSNYNPFVIAIEIKKKSYMLNTLLAKAESSSLFSGEEHEKVMALKSWATRYMPPAKPATEKQNIAEPLHMKTAQCTNGNNSLMQKISALYHDAAFRNENDRKAFLSLARIYLGRGSDGKQESSLTSLVKRQASGSRLFDAAYRSESISHEGKARLSLLQEAYEVHAAARQDRIVERRKRRLSMTVNAQMIKWKDKFSGAVTERLRELYLAYLGKGKDYQKSYRTVEERYEAAERALLSLGKLSHEEKKAAAGLYAIFRAYDNRDYARHSRDGSIESKRENARRNALRVRHANTLAFMLGQVPVQGPHYDNMLSLKSSNKTKDL